MSRTARLLFALLAAPAALAAQGSPIVPLDDPLLPLFEHLVTRGVVRDPTPFVRPFRRAEAVVTLREAVPSADSAEIALVLRAWTPRDKDGQWRADIRVGGQAFTSARRDLLRPEGTGGTRVYGDLGVSAVLGPVVLATRPSIEQRIVLDPDWPGQWVSPSQVCCRWRFPEAYLAYQPGVFRLQLGQVARNWGPVGVAGIAMSEVAYPRDDIAFEVLSRDLHLLSTVAELRDVTNPDGTVIRRYHVATRIGIRLGRHWHLAGWQAAVLEGPARSVEGVFRNPLILLPLANQIGTGDLNNNVMVGGQLQWRNNRGVTVQGELAVDDFAQQNRAAFPDRYAMTLAATGPGPARTAWRALYTRASSLAFRTFDPNENFTEQGIGLGRGRADNDLLMVAITRPVRGGWLAGLDFAVVRQGEGRLDQPLPTTRPIPGIFIGTVERTLRAAVRLAGRGGPLDVSGEIGMNRVTNAHHLAGNSRLDVEGRVTALIHFGASGSLR